MYVLAIFWLNGDNFVTVIARNMNRTIEGDLWEYENTHSNYNHNTLIGQEIWIELE